MSPREMPCLGEALQDLLPASARHGRPLAVYALREHRTLRPFWPEFKFQATPLNADLVATSRPWPGRAGVLFRPGVLRASSKVAGSSTIAGTFWRGAAVGSLGARLALHPALERERERGADFAAAVVERRLGGVNAALPPSRVTVPGDTRLVVASGSVGVDEDVVQSLLLSGMAASIVLVGGSERLVRRVQALGGMHVASPDPWTLIHGAAEIHAPAGSEIALLARLAGRTVIEYGVALPSADPGQLAAAYLLLGTRYLDPADGRPITPEAFLDRMVEWRRLRQGVPNIACVAGISFWKKRRIADFLGVEPVYARTAADAVAAALRLGGGIAVWPSRAPTGLDEAAAEASVPVMRIEDGFIRSRGLGADFIPPASIIIDRRGIYYDPRSLSDLEYLLQTADFTPDLLVRAHRLAQELVRRGITKYGVGGSGAALPNTPGLRRILVPGQVADDKSVLAGGGGLSPGLPLLERVRAANPDAHIIYKPHPDVEAGHRPGAVPDALALRHADMVLRDVPMAGLIEAVDEIHTLTSLAGFEGLLRGRRVVTYGTPFYAGWGLTTDLTPPTRPRRTLSLDALVAATLILYPLYLDPVSTLPCRPEELIQRLDDGGVDRLGVLVAARRLQGAWRRRLGRSAPEVA